MDYQLCVKLRNSITARAHLYGAEAIILQKQFEQDFLPVEGETLPVSVPDGKFITSSSIFCELVKRGITKADPTDSSAFPEETLFGRSVLLRDREMPESLLERQRRLLSVAQEAAEARCRYFRELEAVDLLGGHSSAFTELGQCHSS